MYKQITGSVKGQDKAVRQIVSTMDRNINLENYRNKTNMLIIGPSGSGKTEIFRSIASKLDIPMVIEDSEQYSATGYVGSDITDMFETARETAKSYCPRYRELRDNSSALP